MRVLLLADASFSRREHAFLQRVEFGLMGEGWRVVRAVPEASHAIQPVALHGVVGYREIRSRFGKQSALRRFAEGLKTASPAITTDADGVLFDIVHAYGGACWERAAATAQHTGAALVIELVSANDIRAAKGFERAHGPKSDDDPPITWCAPNQRFFKAVQSIDLAGHVALTPWGVHTPKHRRPPHPPDQPVALSVVCSGTDPRAVIPLFKAFAALGDQRERAMLFVDATAAEVDRTLWGSAEALDILDRVTFVADMESRREIVLATDALAIPEQMGELRTILLDAMAGGMLVISRRDPLIEATAAEGVAMLLDAPTEENWSHALREVLDHPQQLRSFGERARDRVREDRPVHKHINAVLQAYHEALAPTPLRINQ